ncbi:MAG: hypothetical protein LBV26_05820 [Bacteroidales bacterium]|jgi:hypothetical protein|nr:hypothetical protein [Bacteroidales bacterium]
MGAFLLVSKNSTDFNEGKAIDVIKQQCMAEPSEFDLPDGWRLFLFRKALVDAGNFRISDKASLFATGTPYIHGKSYADSLDYVFRKLCDNNEIPAISGQYFMLFQNEGRLLFKTDASGIYSIYHTADATIISSSFMAIAEGLGKLSPDRDTLLENLLTGSITGSDTVFKEIKRFEPQLPADLAGIRFATEAAPEQNTVQYKNRKESQNAQIEALDNCFAGMAAIVNEYGADAGITGGFDSRLILAMALRKFDAEKLQFHSHKRKNIDRDFIAGEELCKLKNLNFVNLQLNDTCEEDNSAVENILSRSMLFCDGQVRTNCFWHEEFNTAGYRINILHDKKLGLSGIGGEQYRNMEKYFYPGLDRFIRLELVIRHCGQNIAGSKTIDGVVARISDKIKKRLNVKQQMDMTAIKQCMNHIYIPANRGLRGSYENRLSFFLYPFADREVSAAAINAAKFLGWSMDYEAELIKYVAPELMDAPASYSFRLGDGEPLGRIVSATVLNNFIPCRLSNRIKEFVFPQDISLWETFMCRFEVFSKSFLTVKRLGLPVKPENLIKRKGVGPLVFAMGFLLDRFKEKLVTD